MPDEKLTATQLQAKATLARLCNEFADDEPLDPHACHPDRVTVVAAALSQRWPLADPRRRLLIRYAEQLVR